MPGSKRTDREKGQFSGAGLRVAKAYVMPRKWRLAQYGCYAVLAIVAYVIVDNVFLKSRFVSGGPLSSAHARIETSCMKCHTPAKGVADQKCSICHEKTGDALGVYSAAAHSVYRSGDAKRAALMVEKHHGSVQSCADCHTEHRGREAQITRMSDQECLGCHDYGSFNRKHPEFQFVRDRIPDSETLHFTHRRHLAEVMRLTQEPNAEQACIYCHVAEPDGKHFRPIDFEVHCAQCHLTPGIKTDLLPVRQAADPTAPGVETLEMIRARGGPGTTWAYYSSPSEFTQRGDKVKKSPIYHEDPWILENLRQIRRRIYPNAGLADLVKFGANEGVPSTQLYREAIQTLDGYAMGLRGRPEPEIVTELQWIDSLLTVARRKVRSANNDLGSDPAFSVAASGVPAAGAARQAALDTLAAHLALKCTECHQLVDGALLRVTPDQRTLRRTEFDHAAHIVDRRCLACHTSIPMTDEMLAGKEFDPAMDTASIQNIPGIQNCRECHKPDEASNRCTTCHLYHPNETQRGNLLLFKPAL